MTDLVVTAAQVGVLDPTKAQIKSYPAGATITAGMAVAITTTGTVVAADASTGGAHLIQLRGVALNGGGAGQAVDVLHEGELFGFTIAGLDVGAVVYLSNTAGLLADAAGDVTVIAGVVNIVTDGPTFTKVLRLATAWTTIWA